MNDCPFVKVTKFTLMPLLCYFSMSSGLAQITGDDQFDHRLKYRIPEIALLDLESAESNKDITFGIKAPTEAGNTVSFSEDAVDYLWLNYTSIINNYPQSNDKKRVVSVKISSGVMPSGFRLKIRAKSASSHGSGNKGTSSGWKYVSYSDQALINNIRSAYTGNGPKKGHQLEIKLELSPNNNDFSLLNASQNNSEIVLTYTISDN